MLKKQIVLYYHHVGKASSDSRYKRMYVSPAILKMHIIFLKLLRYSFTTISDLKNHPNKKMAAVTFDDGYVDNLTHALPIFLAKNIPATIYVITNDVGKKNIKWSESGNAETVELLDWKDLKTLQDTGWEIGSHSSEHVHHDQLNKRSQELLIEKSFADLQLNLGTRERSFCYPYGSFNLHTKQVLEGLNIRAAVSTNIKSDDPRLQIPRVNLYGQRLDHLPTSIAKILWALI